MTLRLDLPAEIALRRPPLRCRRGFATLLVVLAVTLFLTAWRFRPLRADERSLVGTWVNSLALKPNDDRFTFRIDHRYHRVSGPGNLFDRKESDGNWSLREGRLTMTEDPDWPERWSAMKSFLGGSGWHAPLRSEVRFLELSAPDEMRWLRDEQTWTSEDEYLERVPEELSSRVR